MSKKLYKTVMHQTFEYVHKVKFFWIKREWVTSHWGNSHCRFFFCETGKDAMSCAQSYYKKFKRSPILISNSIINGDSMLMEPHERLAMNDPNCFQNVKLEVMVLKMDKHESYDNIKQHTSGEDFKEWCNSSNG